MVISECKWLHVWIPVLPCPISLTLGKRLSTLTYQFADLHNRNKDLRAS